MKPIIKHPGGKRRISGEILDLLGRPPELCEPFAGGLAVSLEGSRPRFVAEAIPVIRSLYQTLASLPSAIWAELDAGPKEIRSSEEFNALRARFNKNQTPGAYIALCYSCFNGLARFNMAGGFNASTGAPLPKRIPRFGSGHRAAYEEAFSRCEVFEDWRGAVQAAAEEGVPIYADPPYVGTFAYAGASGSWGMAELEALALALPVGSALSERVGSQLKDPGASRHNSVEEALSAAGFELALSWMGRNVISRGERTERAEGVWVKKTTT